MVKVLETFSSMCVGVERWKSGPTRGRSELSGKGGLWRRLKVGRSMVEEFGFCS
jgi:hypothetical protein